MKKLKQSKESLNCKELSDSEYRCDKCRDLTFIIDDGVAFPCECRAVREAEDILKKSGVSFEFRKKRFDNFNYDYDVQTVSAYGKAINYVKDFKSIEGSCNNSIIFMGQVGSGKTHLSLAIANELMDDGVGVLYMSYRDVITRVKQNIMDEVYYHRVMNRYKNARVLLIDDLFKGKLSCSDINIMFEIVNYRYFNNLPVIASTEKGFEELIDIDEAVGSRLVEMCRGRLVEIKGKRLNYRIYG
ncbi:ATP-binding protein [Romboutsia sedimentorum]|uniref:ATP-binding protein n=1 Tax=Romboutsia sedimentorum TaxID=1368474 RepID=UPI0024DF0563|nr:ATP-binding protein [Romboutsia sedimentorum]MDK2585003.1 ATP-binding protein [Romboutsia sedimentorum]